MILLSSVIAFSEEAALKIRFSDSESSDIFLFKSAIDRALQIGKRATAIHKGLDVALGQMFQTFKGMREKVPKAVLLLTDGHDKTPVSLDDFNFKKKFREAGIRVKVVGISEKVNKTELFMLVDKDLDIFFTKDFSQLELDEIILRSISDCRGLDIVNRPGSTVYIARIYIYIYIYILMKL